MTSRLTVLRSPTLFLCVALAAFAIAACSDGSANPAGPADTTRVTRALTTLTFDSTTRALPSGIAPAEVVVADVDNANGPDIVFYPSIGGIGVLLNGGGGSFTGAPVLTPASGCVIGRTHAIAVEQLSADTNPDVLIGCQNAGALERWRGAGDGTFAAPDLYAPLTNGQGFNPYADAFNLTFGPNGNAGPSLTYAQAFVGSPSFSVLCSFSTPDLIASFDQGLDLRNCTFNTDANGDITNFLSLELQAGFALGTPPPAVDPGPSAFAFRQDLKLGSIIRNINRNTPSDTSVGGFDDDAYTPPNDTSGETVFAAGDLDGDGVAEILSSTGFPEAHVYHVQPRTQIAEGSFSIAAPTVTLINPNAGDVLDFKLADLDGDGHLDLIVLSTIGDGVTGTIEIHPGKGDGTFGEAQSFAVDADSNHLNIADLDGDGRPDIVVPNGLDQHMTFMLNRTAAPPQDHPPVCAGGSASTTADTALSGAVTCSDPDAGDTIAIAVVATPAHGSVTVNPNGTFSYTPAQGFTGTDSFTFAATDSRGVGSNVATESILVVGNEAGKLGYAVVSATSSGPPFPIPPVLLGVTGVALTPPNPVIPVELLGFSLTSVCIPTDPCTPAGFRLDAAIPPNPISATPAAVPPNPIRQTFDVLVTFDPASNGAVGPALTPPNPIVPPNPIDVFDVSYDVFLPGVAVTTQTLHFQIAPGQPYQFAEVAAGLPQSPKFHVAFTLEPNGSGTQAPGALWTVTPSGTIAPADATAPVLTVPVDFTVDATSPAGATVTYTATATDDQDPSPHVVCAPASGSTFPIGTTTVSCTATDAGGNATTRTFKVHVRDAAEQIARLIAKVRADLGLRPLRPGILDHLEDAAEALLARRPGRVCFSLGFFITEVRLAPPLRLNAAEKADLTADARRISAVIGCF
jgi:VCBS repeat-containing protein